MKFKTLLIKHKKLLILLILLFIAGIGSIIFDRHFKCPIDILYEEFVFTRQEIHEMAEELDKAGVLNELHESGCALWVFKKDIPKAIIHLSSKGLPRQTKTPEEIRYEQNPDLEESAGFGPHRLKSPIMLRKKCYDNKFEEITDVTITPASDIVYKSGNHNSRKKIQSCIREKPVLGRRERRARNYYKKAARQLAETIVSIDGIKEAYIKVIPGTWSDWRDRQLCTSCVTLKFKTGFTPGKKLIRTIEHLTTHNLGELKVKGVRIVDENGKILNDEK